MNKKMNKKMSVRIMNAILIIIMLALIIFGLIGVTNYVSRASFCIDQGYNYDSSTHNVEEGYVECENNTMIITEDHRITHNKTTRVFLYDVEKAMEE